MYAWLAERIIKYRVWIMVTMIGLAAVFATTLPDLGFNFTPQQIFESTSSANAYREKFADRFGREDNLVTIAVIGEDIFAPQVLQTMRELTVELRGVESIKNAESVATFEIPRSGDAPGTMTVEPILDQDVGPVGAASGTISSGTTRSITASAAKRLEEVALSEPLVRERLVSENGDMALVVAWLQDDLQDADELEGAVESIEDKLSEHPLPEGYSYRTGGIPTLRTQIVDQLRTEQLTFVPLTALIYLFILIYLFRRLSGVLLPLATVAFAVLATVATMVWTDSPINIVNNVLPSLIFVIGISDSIHMLARDAEEIEAGKGRIAATKAMIRHTGLACLLTSCTTSVGFISLLAADADILKHFGWQAAAGVMFAYVATIFFLPAALSLMKPVRRKKKHPPHDQDQRDKLHEGALLERVLVRSGEVLLDHAKVVVAVCLLITAGFVVLASTVEIDTTLLEVFHEEHPSYKTTELIEQNLGGFLPVEVSLESEQMDRFKDPQVYAKMARFQEFAKRQPEVLSTQSIVDFHQSARAALLGDPAERQKMPESRAQVEQLHLLIAGAPDDPSGVNKFVTSDFRNARVLVRVADVGAKAQIELAGRLKDKLDTLFGDESGVRYRLTGDAYVASVALDSFIRDLFYSLLVAIVIIFAKMTVVFRSWKLGLVSMLPNTIPMVITFGYMGLVGINLNTTTIIIFAISLGLAVDDTIHFLARFREEIDRRDTAKEAILYTYYGAGRAILLTSVLLVTGLAVLLLSDFVPTRQFGILTSITIGGAVFGDLILLPSLLYLLYRGEDNAVE
jgi:hydrophobe/amphiphile efflux-3 (HAE3) family protein